MLSQKSTIANDSEATSIITVQHKNNKSNSTVLLVNIALCVYKNMKIFRHSETGKKNNFYNKPTLIFTAFTIVTTFILKISDEQHICDIQFSVCKLKHINRMGDNL
jgi:hypothetical protein